MIKLQNFFRNAKSATPSRSEDEKDAETVGLKDEYDEIRHEKGIPNQTYYKSP